MYGMGAEENCFLGEDDRDRLFFVDERERFLLDPFVVRERLLFFGDLDRLDRFATGMCCFVVGMLQKK